MQTLSNQTIEKWSAVFSTPVAPTEATAMVEKLYRCIGCPLPKIVFVDSPWAASIAAEVYLHQSASALTSIREDLRKFLKHVRAQLLRQLAEQFNTAEDCTIAAQISGIAATKFCHREAHYWRGGADLTPWQNYFRTPLDELSTLATAFNSFGHPCLKYAWRDWMAPYRGASINSDWLTRLLDHLQHRLRLNIPINMSEAVYSFPTHKPIGCSSVTDAAVFDAASRSCRFEPELLTLVLKTAWHLGYINPFAEICFVSDRPRFQRDAQNRLHAEGEPAVVFPDSFGMDYFHHGTRLPQYLGRVPPNRWQPQWILKERNAEVRRCLIQELGYARMCQELEVEKLDSWREYTLLKLPLYDDYRSKQPQSQAVIEATYLLKMLCPSTGQTHAIRVPPGMQSAREAATWINWGSDPEWFTLET